MKRLISIVISLIAFTMFATLATVSSALADKAFSPTCGNNAGHGVTRINSAYWNPVTGRYFVDWQQNCGTGGTVEWEIQQSPDGGNHWYDYKNVNFDDIDNLFTTPSGDANVSSPELQGSYKATCLGAIERAHVWDANSDLTKTINC